MIDEDLTTYATEVMRWLTRDPVANNVACTVILQRLDATLPTEPDALWLRVLDEGNRVVGAAFATPPWGLLLTAMPAAAVDVLAHEVADRGIMLPFANGPDDVASTFAARYAALTGVAAKPGMAQGLYRLDRVEPPTGVPGTLRACRNRPSYAMWISSPSCPFLQRKVVIVPSTVPVVPDSLTSVTVPSTMCRTEAGSSIPRVVGVEVSGRRR